MCNQAPTCIDKICPVCHPHSSIKTLASFTGEVKEAATEDQIQVAMIQQRNAYLHNKLQQLDQVKDARKHTHRLAHIMKYHELLTDVEVAHMRNKLRKAFKAGDTNEKTHI